MLLFCHHPKGSQIITEPHVAERLYWHVWLVIPLCLKEGGTHFESMKCFSHASSVFFCRTSLKDDERALAKAGLALAGMHHNVGWFNWHTWSKVGRS